MYFARVRETAGQKGIFMKFTISYPALIRGVPPQCKGERFCLVASRAEFEIAEVAISEMTLAAVAHARNSVPVEYRIRDGVLYRYRDDADDLEIEIEGEDVLAYGRSLLYHEVAAEIMAFLKLHGGETWPRNAHRRQKDGATSLAESGIDLSSAGIDDLRYWRERMQSALDRYVIADGRVWARSREPLFAVNLKSASVTLDDAGLYRNEPMELTTRRRPRIAETAKDYVCVSGLDREAALREAGHPAGADVGDRLEIVLPEAFNLDIDRLELDRAARVAVEDASEGLARAVPGGEGNLLNAAPGTLMVSWLGLRDYLGGYDPLDGVPEDLGDRLAGFLDEVDRLPWTRSQMVMGPETRRMVERAMAGWDNRAVSLSAAAPRIH